MGCSVSTPFATKRCLNGRSKTKQDFHQTYTLGTKIGSGAFGAVYKARHIDSTGSDKGAAKFAVKVLSKKSRDGPSASVVVKEFYSEVEMLVACTGKHIIQFIEAFEDKSFCYLVMELCQCTVLEAFLENDDVTEEDLPKIFVGMAEGIAQCHKVQVVHRDIKPQNFLLANFARGVKISDKNSTCVAKLCDLGMAIKMPSKGSLTEVCGTAPFMAPEMLNHVGYDYKADVWSFGGCVYLMLFGAFPYHPAEPNAAKMKALIKEGKVPISFSVGRGLEQPSKDGVEFCKTLLNRDAMARPTSLDMLVLPYLKTHREPLKYARDKSRTYSIHSNLSKAQENARLAQKMGRKRISPEALEKFEKELDKLVEKHGVRRSTSERTMTLPAHDSQGSLKLPLEDNVNTTPATDGEANGDMTRKSSTTSGRSVTH